MHNLKSETSKKKKKSERRKSCSGFWGAYPGLTVCLPWFRAIWQRLVWRSDAQLQRQPQQLHQPLQPPPDCSVQQLQLWTVCPHYKPVTSAHQSVGAHQQLQPLPARSSQQLQNRTFCSVCKPVSSSQQLQCLPVRSVFWVPHFYFGATNHRLQFCLLLACSRNVWHARREVRDCVLQVQYLKCSIVTFFFFFYQGVKNNLALGSTSLHSGLSAGGSGELLPVSH